MSAQAHPSKQQLAVMLESALSAVDCQLVDYQMTGGAKQTVLRVFIERQDVTQPTDMDSIIAATRQLKAAIAVENYFPQSLSLEVSSPGVERPLKKIEDYQRFEGRLAKISLQEQADLAGFPEALRNNLQIKAVLTGINPDDSTQVILEVESEKCYLAFSDIKKAHLLLAV